VIRLCYGTARAMIAGALQLHSHSRSFVLQMRECFAPPNEDRRLQDEWANLRQHGSVFEYVSLLTILVMQIPGLSRTQILDKFIRGLKPKTKIEVKLRDSQTPDEAYRLADRFDRIVYGVRNASTYPYAKLQPLFANAKR
jgi:hypothetical protein